MREKGDECPHKTPCKGEGCKGLELDSKVQAFETWFSYEIETRLKRLPDLNYNCVEDHSKIAIVTLAFNNTKVIQLLKQRGTAIANQNWKEKNKVERSLIELKNDEKRLKKLTNPCHIFITFQYEEGVERIKKYNQYCEEDESLEDIKLFLGQRLEFIEASEPSDIIWENRHFTPEQRKRKAWVAFSILTLLLLVSFGFQFHFQRMADLTTAKFPSFDCAMLVSGSENSEE